MGGWRGEGFVERVWEGEEVVEMVVEEGKGKIKVMGEVGWVRRGEREEVGGWGKGYGLDGVWGVRGL